MHPINVLIIVLAIGYILVDGVRRAKGTREIEGYFLARRSLPWWAVGLSVMATQLSAITMIGTTGQGATQGMGLVQMYFGLPIAMAILGVTLVPLLRGAKVFTAYEFLERRFGPGTRSLTALLFLLSRGMSCGVIIGAPAVVFSAIFAWPIYLSVAVVGLPTIAYTMLGGVQAVTWADVKQMVLIVCAVAGVAWALIAQLPVSLDEGLRIAGAAGRLEVFDFSLALDERFTFWSGMLGGTFLMLSYFGTDQSQVQRYLAAESVAAARSSLMMSAYWKIPLQALVLLVGVLVFVHYQFATPPLLFNPVEEAAVTEARGGEYAALQADYSEATLARSRAASDLARASAENLPGARAAYLERESEASEIRAEALRIAGEVTGSESDDGNFIMPRFVLDFLPTGLAGLFIAAVIAAAMSSISSELNSLSTTSVIDFYRRWIRPEASEAHYLLASKIATTFWGLFACVFATYMVGLDTLINLVNEVGSLFYGSILGVFLLAMVPFAKARGAVAGLILGMAAVWSVKIWAPEISYLWHNVVGVLAALGTGTLVSLLPRRGGQAPLSPSSMRLEG